MQKHRDDLWAAEQKEWTEKRKPIVEKLKPELDRLEEKRKQKTSDWEFAEFIWKEWPPKTEGRFDTSSSRSTLDHTEFSRSPGTARIRIV